LRRSNLAALAVKEDASVNSLKTLCVAIVLSAVAYGAYVTLTGRADGPPPPDAGDWANVPQVQLPEMSQTAMASAGSPTPPPSYVPTSAAPAPEAPQYLTPSAPGSEPPPAMPQADPAATPLSTDPFPNATAGAPLASLGSGIDTVTPTSATDNHDEFVDAWKKAQTMLDQGQLAEALLFLSDWVTNTHLSSMDREQLLDLLDRLAGTVIYSKQHLLEPAYTVQPGDSLEKIGERYGVPYQLLGKINGIADGQAIRPGDQLKVMRGPFDALVSLHDFEMTLFLYGRYAGRFRIGIGQDQSTPEAELTVQNKVINPTYYGPTQVLGPEDPANPLGGRWIDLGNRIGIHGTNDPGSIGRAESRGCIRLAPSDIADVYDILSVGSRVTIWR
jgi:hypothetical protein